MRVAALELPAAWDHRERQLAAVDALLTFGPDAELVLLPEASLTGYVSPDGDFDLSRWAEPRDGQTERALGLLAKKHRVHLVGPVIERAGDCVYNAMVAFGPDGAEVMRYRKRHPWYPETWATPGDDPHPVVTIGELRATIGICFDIHFMDSEAEESLKMADLLLFPSAWVEDPDSRAATLSSLARRHGVAIANANWGAGSPRVAGQGATRIYSRDGSTVAEALAGRADAVIQPRSRK